MTIDDLITAVRVSEPALSPDGATVAFTRTITNGQTGRRNGDIWAVPADGSAPPKALIAGDASDTSAGVLERRQAARVRLVTRGRAASVRRPTPTAATSSRSRRSRRRADAAHVLARRLAGRLRLRRLSRLPRRSLQRAQRPRKPRRIRSRRIASRGSCIAIGPTGARTSAITCSSPISPAARHAT